MKKLMLLAMASAGLAIYACGGGGGSSASSTNPNDAAALFAKPTGKVTTANVDAVATAGIQAQKANSAGGAGIIALKKDQQKPQLLDLSGINAITSAQQSCITTSGNTSTINWKCFAPTIDTNCTGDGTTVAVTDSSAQTTTVTFNNFSYDCTGDTAIDFSCVGSLALSTDSAKAGYVCGDFTCTFGTTAANSLKTTFDGCTDPNGDYLVTVSGDNFVVKEAIVDDSCGTATITVTDSAGTKTITCDVASHADTCTSATDINTVDHCTIS